MMKRLSAIAAAGAALLMVSGCTAPSGGPAGVVSAPSTSVPSTASSPSSAGLPAPVAPPDGYTMVTAAANKIHVPLPDALEVLDPSQIAANQDMQQNLTNMAQKLGITTDALLQELDNLDIYAADGDSNNVNILQPLPSIGTTLADVQPSLENLGVTGVTSRDAVAPTGPALVVTYTMTQNDVTMSGTQLYVQTDTMTTTVITITGVTWTADQVTQIANVMLASLQHV